MNTYTFVGALVIAGIYLLLRFLEMRFVLKENKPLKILLREAGRLSFVICHFIH